MLEETDLVSKPSDVYAYARELPAEYEGQWIAELVRSFAGARGLADPVTLADYWQEAVIAATDALTLAARKPEVPSVALVKRAVRSRLTDLNRRIDRRAGVVGSTEDLPREEDDDGSLRLVEERFEDSAFDRLPRRLTSDIGLALVLLGARERRTWEAFRATSGSSREIAAWLGDVSHMTVQRRLLPNLLTAFRRAYGLVRTIRLKAA